VLLYCIGYAKVVYNNINLTLYIFIYLSVAATKDLHINSSAPAKGQQCGLPARVNQSERKAVTPWTRTEKRLLKLSSGLTMEQQIAETAESAEKSDSGEASVDEHDHSSECKGEGVGERKDGGGGERKGQESSRDED
jgi:hypothetical protein